MPFLASILLLFLLGLFVLFIVLNDPKLSAVDYVRLTLVLGLQGFCLMVYSILNDRPPLAMAWHVALFVTLVFPLPILGYAWALDRISFAGRLPRIVRAFVLSFSGMLVTIVTLFGWVIVWFVFLIILRLLGILPNEPSGV